MEEKYSKQSIDRFLFIKKKKEKNFQKQNILN